MPFVLRNQQTWEVYTCPLINLYQIPYHGVKAWDSTEQADKEAAEFLQQQGIANPEDWTITEVEEKRLKLFNVKLKNDPSRRLFVDQDGNIDVRVM